MRTNGTSPARDYFEALAPGDQVKFAYLFTVMAEHGQIARGKEKFRTIGQVTCVIGGVPTVYRLFEFKAHGERILTFQDGRQWVLTNGFAKGAKLSVEKDKAKAIITEDLSRR